MQILRLLEIVGYTYVLFIFEKGGLFTFLLAKKKNPSALFGCWFDETGFVEVCAESVYLCVCVCVLEVCV